MSVLKRKSAPGLNVAATVVFVAIIGTYVAALAIDGEMLDRLSWEDGLIEYLGSFFFLAATAGFVAVSLLAAKAGHNSAGSDNRHVVVFGLLAALMFICFGEEISWGQRIFGWSTPEAISELNAQNETNFHNLHIVHQ